MIGTCSHKNVLELITNLKFGIITQGISELELQEDVQKSRKSSLSSKKATYDFKMMMPVIVERLDEGTVISSKRHTIAYFGTPVIVITKCWDLTQENNKDKSEEVKTHENKDRLLWALHCVKNTKHNNNAQDDEEATQEILV